MNHPTWLLMKKGPCALIVLGLLPLVAMLCLLTPATAKADLATNLQMNCTMDNISPAVAQAYWEDVSGNDHVARNNPPGYNGTGDTGGANRGTAIDFTGTEVYRMQVKDGLSSDFDPGITDYSLSFWYNETENTGANNFLLASGCKNNSEEGGFSILSASGRPYLRINDVNEDPLTKVTVDSGMNDLSGTGWHHVVAVFDRSGTYSPANTVSLYVDNVMHNSAILADINDNPYDVMNVAEQINLGGKENSANSALTGYMDDVAIYRGALSTTDINTLYTATTLDATTITTGGIAPVMIHNFVTNRGVDAQPSIVSDDYGTNDGTAKYNAVQVTDATRGLVLDVETGSDRVMYGDVLDPGTGSYTVAGWIKITDTDANQQILGKGMETSSAQAGFRIMVSSTDKFHVWANYGGTLGGRLGVKMDYAPDDQWHHVAMVIDQDNGVLKAYFDGNASSDDAGNLNAGWAIAFTSDCDNTFASGADFTSLGKELAIAYQPTNTSTMDGRMDDFAIWDRALTDAEIFGIFNGDKIPDSNPIPGDTNGDKIINDTDADMVASHWGQTIAGGASVGDFNNDGVVNATDASIMAANWGDHNESEGSAVPEPSTIILMIVGAMIGLMLRRR